MAPKTRFEREDISRAAFQLVRRQGIESLSVRNLAAELGCSTAPIFTAFTGIGEVEAEVVRMAEELYSEYFRRGINDSRPFKGAGMSYVLFAKEEPLLFKLLFMRPSGKESKAGNYFPHYFKYEGDVRGVIKNSHAVDDDLARDIYNHLSVYVHGLACLYAEGQCYFTDEQVKKMISQVFISLMEANKK